MIIAEKIKLKPNKRQKTYFRKACGSARFAYNWALAKNEKQYDAYKENNDLPKPNWISLSRDLTRAKKRDLPWMYDVATEITRRPINDLDKALKSFFKGKAQFPKFKKKGCKDSFYVCNKSLKVENKGSNFTLLR